jgi:tetratricopeptide (TPR) repeat protein
MQIPILKNHKNDLTPLERHQVRTLVLRDTGTLLSLFLITVVLAVVTHFLFNSYSNHKTELAARWFKRGQQAMQSNQPLVAIDDYHSSLLYAPGQRQIEIALASALASAGRIQEATAYFNTLRDAEPGNGEINLQLARLAARQGNENLAKEEYHAAIYGNWEGDGYLKRRNARLELVRYLISRGRFDQARSELLVASGNAPSSDLQMQSTIAELLTEDHFPADALALDRQLLAQHPESTEALQGAASTAYSLGDYQSAFRYLQKLIASSGYTNLPADVRQSDQDLLHKTGRIIVLDPSTSLPASTLASRLLADREIARRRLKQCEASLNPVPPNGPGKQQANTTQLQSLSDTWNNEPDHLTMSDLIDDPAAEEKERNLIGETEKITAAACGAPSGDDAILLRLAMVPSLNDTSLESGHE